jgi:hypothetical protein
LSEVQNRWSASQFTGTYADAKEQSAEFNKYKQTTKRTWVTERQDLATLFGNVQTKLKTYGLREYIPPAGLALTVGLFRSVALNCLNMFPTKDLDEAWKALLKSEARRSRAINAQIRE